MQDLVLKRLRSRVAAYDDLGKLLDEDLLGQRIDVPKHKSLAEHLWCVIGARESYARAIEAGAWEGFSCSMESFAPADFAAKLAESSTALEASIGSVADWTDERSDLLLALAEHEVMHEGQIIRHMYALERTLPDSWAWA